MSTQFKSNKKSRVVKPQHGGLTEDHSLAPARCEPAKRVSKPESTSIVAKPETKKLGRPASNAKILKRTYAEAVTGVAEVEDKSDSFPSLSENVPFSAVSSGDQVEPTVPGETSPTVHEEHETSLVNTQPADLEFASSTE